MRKNYPVTQKELPFPKGGTLVSTTDLKGRILYGNPSFYEVSGFTREELVGQAHSIIRHPDMPEEAFRDLWATIQSGKPWIGPVKNRRKNGDHYWVLASVTPLMEGDRPVGYMSVRTEAPRAMIEASDALYKRMQEEARAGRNVHVFRGGRLLKNTPLGWITRYAQLGIAGKTVLATVACAMLAELTSDLPVISSHRSLALLAAAVVGVLIGFVAQRVVTAPLQKVVSYANRLAAGDLTQSVDEASAAPFEELQRALNQLTVNLRAIVGDARNEMEQMNRVMHDLAEENQSLSQRTEAQATQLQQTAASMEQITGTVRNNTTSAVRASGLAGEATVAAERGRTAVDEVNRAMGAIHDASTKIGEATEVIQGLAFQTNILALNAAVEAARAGEMGRGFSIVAAEVRALAQKAASSAKEISALIGDSNLKVQAGDDATTAARATMEGIVTSARELGQFTQQISTGSEEQLTGISQVTDAIHHIDAITQQNAGLVQDIAQAAHDLESEADRVVGALQVFKLASSTPSVQNDAAAQRARRQTRREPSPAHAA
ncbi:MAG: methyl-accepting chemotaxis protein [Polyangiaceae bacterium]